MRVDVMVGNPKPPSSPPADIVCIDPGRTCLAAEFLSLLDDPDGTSDLTVIAGGGNGSAAGGCAGGALPLLPDPLQRGHG